MNALRPADFCPGLAIDENSIVLVRPSDLAGGIPADEIACDEIAISIAANVNAIQIIAGSTLNLMTLRRALPEITIPSSLANTAVPFRSIPM